MVRRGAGLAATVLLVVVPGCGSRTLTQGAADSSPATTSTAHVDPWPAPTPPVFDSFEAQARALLGRLQAEFTPPPGAVETGPPSGGLGSGTSLGGLTLAASRYWTVPGSPEAALAYLQAHMVQGAAMGSSRGYGSDTEPRSFDEEVPEEGIPTTEVLGDVSPAVVAAGGRTNLGVDFIVRYSGARPAGEEVTAADRFLVVTRSEQGRPAATVTFSDPATVVALANTFNALATTDTTHESCPAAPVGYTVSFAPAPGKPADFVGQGVGCDAWFVTVRGKRVAQLQDSAVGDRVAALFGP